MHQRFASSCNTSRKKIVIIDIHRLTFFQWLLHWYHTISASCITSFLPPQAPHPYHWATIRCALTRDAKRSISSLGSPLSVVKTFWLQLLEFQAAFFSADSKGIGKRLAFSGLVVWRVKHLYNQGLIMVRWLIGGSKLWWLRFLQCF